MKPAITDPEISYEVVVTDDDSLELVMHFQDGASPDRVARVAVQMGEVEALKLATELVAAARSVGADTVAFCEALLHAQHRAMKESG